MERKKRFLPILTILAIVTILFSSPSPAQTNASSLVGSSVTNFSLSSAQGRLVSYGEEYYGRFNLIITFFPAAFTPV